MDVVGVDSGCVDVVAVFVDVVGVDMRVVASVKWSDKRWSNEIWITVKIPPASSMFCVRNLSWYIGFGADLGSEALVGMS